MTVICFVSLYLFIRSTPSEIVVNTCNSKKEIKIKLLVGLTLKVQNIRIARNDYISIAHMTTNIGVVPINLKQFENGMALLNLSL